MKHHHAPTTLQFRLRGDVEWSDLTVIELRQEIVGGAVAQVVYLAESDRGFLFASGLRDRRVLEMKIQFLEYAAERSFWIKGIEPEYSAHGPASVATVAPFVS